MRVLLEHEATERRRVFGRMRTVSVWVKAWVAEVLYADASIVITRSAGAHQTFGGVPTLAALKKRAAPRDYSFGSRLGGGIEAHMWGHKPDHPSVVKLGLKRDRYGRLNLGRIRISPLSAIALRKEMSNSGVTFIVRQSVSVMRISRHVQRLITEKTKALRGKTSAAGKKRSCKSSPTRRVLR